MSNAGLDEAQSGIKIAGRNINNLRYTDDTTLMAESKELKSLMMKVKNKSSRKISTSALLTMTDTLTLWITTNCGEFLKRWEYQTTLLASWEICMQVKKQ